MQTRLEKLFKLFIGLLTVLAVAVLGFVIFFIVKEALPLFKEVSLGDFLLGTRWLPIAYAGAIPGLLPWLLDAKHPLKEMQRWQRYWITVLPIMNPLW